MTTIEVGQIYRDCSYHPVLCTEVYDDDVAGVSLIDGSSPRSCSIRHCGVEVMDWDDVRKTLIHRDEFLLAQKAFQETWDTNAFYKRLEELGIV